MKEDKTSGNNDRNSSHQISKNEYSNGTNIIPLRKESGVYYITININDVPMDAVFDTGAATISLSQTEVTFLYKQGKLTEEDFIGSQNFINANGDVTEGALVNLKYVKIGNKIVRNVTASVVPNMEAPVLLGQSALNKLGKISVDFDQNVLIFE